jgi:cytochrome c oxidase subunit I+III
VPAFSRRPMVGYPFVAVATVMTANIAFGVWAHHMFAVGLSMVSLAFFSIASLFVVVPSGVQYAAWIATLWSGRPVLKTPLLFVLGFLVTFLIGGLTGPMFAAAPFDWQTTDSYFVVAHFHYVLFGGAVFPIFGGLYYWLPKMTGKMLDEKLGVVNFWFVFIGFQLTFFPMHIVGLLGMPRRTYTYLPGLGWDGLNLLETMGGYILGIGVLLFLVNLFWSVRGGREAGPNPWGAGTLEWATQSPPEPYNYRVIPTIRSRDPLWDQDELFDPSSNVNGARVTLGTSMLDANPREVLPMPEDSGWPLIVAIGMAAFFVGWLISAGWVAVLGLFIIIFGVGAWNWPTREEGMAKG